MADYKLITVTFRIHSLVEEDLDALLKVAIEDGLAVTPGWLPVVGPDVRLTVHKESGALWGLFVPENVKDLDCALYLKTEHTGFFERTRPGLFRRALELSAKNYALSKEYQEVGTLSKCSDYLDPVFLNEIGLGLPATANILFYVQEPDPVLDLDPAVTHQETHPRLIGPLGRF